MGNVFISYRRCDSGEIVERIQNGLNDLLPEVDVFRDVGGIKSGQDWIDTVRESIDRCDLFLAVVGPGWLTRDESGISRIDKPDDVVRREIERAFEMKVTVLPVLVAGGKMPRKDELPKTLNRLRRRQAHRIRKGHFAEDLQELSELIEEVVEEKKIDEPTQEEANALLDEIDEAGGFEVLHGVFLGDFSVEGKWRCKIVSQISEQQPWFGFDGRAVLEFYIPPRLGTFEGWWEGSHRRSVEGRWMLNMDPDPPNRVLGLRLHGHADESEPFDIEIPIDERIGKIIQGTDSSGRTYALKLIERAEF